LSASRRSGEIGFPEGVSLTFCILSHGGFLAPRAMAAHCVSFAYILPAFYGEKNPPLRYNQKHEKQTCFWKGKVCR